MICPGGDDCSAGRVTRGMCHKHYKKALERGELRPLTVGDRFWAKVNKQGGFPDFDDPYVRTTPENGPCWAWTGSVWGGGYGRIKVKGSFMMAHRASLMLQGIPVEKGLDVDHLCRNPLCVRPSHLEPVTRSENTRRGRNFEANAGRKKTHCAQGHEFTPENTRISSRGYRFCVICSRKAKREYMRRVRQQPGS